VPTTRRPRGECGGQPIEEGQEIGREVVAVAVAVVACVYVMFIQRFFHSIESVSQFVSFVH
jgi:hypothetical protein